MVLTRSAGNPEADVTGNCADLEQAPSSPVAGPSRRPRSRQRAGRRRRLRHTRSNSESSSTNDRREDYYRGNRYDSSCSSIGFRDNRLNSESSEDNRGNRHTSRHTGCGNNSKRRHKKRSTSRHITRKRESSRNRDNRRQRKRQRCRSESSSSSESSTFHSSSESDEAVQLPPISYGLKTGDNIEMRLRKKIRENKFIDLIELLPDFHNRFKQNNEIYIKIGEDNRASLKKRTERKELSFTEWSEAFDVFMIISIDEHKTKSVKAVKLLMKEMLTYKKNITQMMKDGGDWKAMDIHFRRDIASNPFSWATTRYELIWHYNNKSRAHVSQKATSFGRKCYKFNTPNKVCMRGEKCDYRHECQYCGQSTHPSYRCYRITRNFNNRSVTYGGNRATAAPSYASTSGAGDRQTMIAAKNGKQPTPRKM